MRRLAILVTILVVAAPLSGSASAERPDGPGPAAPCFDASDRNDIRLWDGTAPGAVGSDACRDIPFLRSFPAAAPASGTTPAIVVIPGGGYDRLNDVREQAPVAAYFSHVLHITTFVLYYRLVRPDGTYRYPVPMWDGQRALKLIRSRAHQFRIDPARIGLFGFSASGHLAATLALHAASDFDLPVHDAVDALSGRPDILGLGYPVISMEPNQFAAHQSLAHLLYGYHGHIRAHLERYLSAQAHVTAHTPPVFLFESMDDQRVSPQNSVLFAQALQQAGTPAEIHLFAHGIHGAGLAQGIPQEQAWPDLFRQWLIRQGFLQRQS